MTNVLDKCAGQMNTYLTLKLLYGQANRLVKL